MMKGILSIGIILICTFILVGAAFLMLRDEKTY